MELLVCLLLSIGIIVHEKSLDRRKSMVIWSYQICSLLLNNGADVTLKNNEDFTALDITVTEDTKELLISAVLVDLREIISCSCCA
uniref:ANK_REP_REGION domain-containing protein n=1 Tax=Wuchereria bancrofti TaxID=6293 RepID=A0A1I8EQ51_WUCBA